MESETIRLLQGIFIELSPDVRKAVIKEFPRSLGFLKNLPSNNIQNNSDDSDSDF